MIVIQKNLIYMALIMSLYQWKKTDKLIVMNNKLKYPININRMRIVPFVEAAVGTNFKEYSVRNEHRLGI